MPRPVNLNKTYRGFNTGDRRWLIYELNRLADKNGIVYERDLPAWWIGRLLHGGYVKRLEKGVLLVMKHE